ncbi:MAG: hypothetical protein IJG85_00345 [Eubacteriaceae bacterium]|nr:hypothetical protein [Eubacteriaceae bacterium]
MKAKTTWLIGLLIALMMVVTAVPAFAQDEQTAEPANQDVAVEAQDDEPNGINVTGFSATKPRAYIGGKIKFNVTFSKNTSDNLSYNIKITDITEAVTGKAATATTPQVAPTMNAVTVNNYSVDTMPTTNSIEIESDPINNGTLTVIGTHTFKITVTPKNGQATDLTARVNVEVREALSGYQTAYTELDEDGTTYVLKGEIGQEIPLSAFASGGYNGYTYEWQRSVETGAASPQVIDNNAWQTFATGNQNTVAKYTMKYGDDNHYIRCIIKDGDGNQIVAPIQASNGGITSQLAVKLQPSSQNTITITNPAAESTVKKMVGQQFQTPKIAATGGTGPSPTYTYQWKKGAANLTETGCNTDQYTIAHVKPADAGNYTCVVTDSQNKDIKATSKNTHLDVVAAPEFSITPSSGTNTVNTEATWDETATPVPGNGEVTLTSDQAAKGLTLNLNITGDLGGSTIKWAGGSLAGKTQFDNKTSATIDGPVTAGDYTVTMGYPSYELSGSGKEATYTLKVKIVGGSITATDGGIYKQAGNGADTTKTVSPEYTLNLPSGMKFKNVAIDNDISDWITDKPDGLTAKVTKVEVLNNALTFKFTGPATKYPFVGDLKVTVPQANIQDGTAAVTFPVSSAYGYQITDAVDVNDIAIKTPGSDNRTNVYYGKPIPAEIVGSPDATIDLGTVTVKYLDKDTYEKIANDNTGKNSDEIKALQYAAASTTAPTNAGTYYVWANITKNTSKAYPDGATGLGPKEYKINPASSATMGLDNGTVAEEKDSEIYFTWTKSKKKTGNKLDADVAFKSGLTKTGKITEIKYKQGGKETIPVDVGTYDIYIKTADDGDKNKCENVATFSTSTKIGTFEITDKDPVPETKLDPTKDLYQMSPTSATADGKEHTTTVTAKTAVAGKVTATNYYDKNGTKVSGSPTKAGEYTVKIDTEENDTYKAAKDLEIGTFTIKGATPTASMYTMDPKSGSSVTANGKGQGVTVTADDPKVAGAPTVKYYDAAGKAVSGQPVKAGKYTVRIDTAATDYYEAGKDIAMGTFEITQGTPTKAMNLYKLDPATNPYTGKANPTKVVAAGDNGAGEVEAIHYTRKTTKVKESDEGPVAIGVYTVTVDAKASDSFKAVKGLEVGDYEIIDQGIFLRAHVENLGWDKTMTELEPGTEKTVGTEGRALRVEAIDIAVPAGYSVEGFAHIQNLDDTKCVVLKGNEADYPAGVPAGYTVYRFGSTGRGLRMEAMQINLKDASGTTMSQLKYCVHVENDGWHAFVNNGTFAGTRGRGLRLEALRFAYAK